MMNTKTIYRLIGLSNNKVQFFRNTKELALFLHGRNSFEYLIIKTDQKGHRLIQPGPQFMNLSTLQDQLASL